MNKHFGFKTMGFGLYCYDMIPDDDGDYCIQSKRYSFKRVSALSDRDIAMSMVELCLDRGYRHFDKHGKHPRRIRASALNGMNYIFVEVI